MEEIRERERETEEEKGRQSGIPLLQENLQFGMKPLAGQKRRKSNKHESKVRLVQQQPPSLSKCFFVPGFSE